MGGVLGVEGLPISLELQVCSNLIGFIVCRTKFGRLVEKWMYLRQVKILCCSLLFLFLLSKNLHIQAKQEKRNLEMGERLKNTPVDVIGEVYQKIWVPGDTDLKSKLVEVDFYKV